LLSYLFRLASCRDLHDVCCETRKRPVRYPWAQFVAIFSIILKRGASYASASCLRFHCLEWVLTVITLRAHVLWTRHPNKVRLLDWPRSRTLIDANRTSRPVWRPTKRASVGGPLPFLYAAVYMTTFEARQKTPQFLARSARKNALPRNVLIG